MHKIACELQKATSIVVYSSVSSMAMQNDGTKIRVRLHVSLNGSQVLRRAAKSPSVKTLVKMYVTWGICTRRAGKLERARSRLRSQILQLNMRWKALAEIYTMHSFAPLSNLKIFVKN